MTATERSLRRSAVARYAIGSIGTGGFATLPGLVLVYYLTDTLGVAAIVAGLVVTAAKVWDVLIDPFIGQRSDRALARTGTRRTWMLAGAVTLPVGFVLTFAVPAGLAPEASAVWVAVAFLATATAFSAFQVPYLALPAELTPGYDERTRLLTWRVVVLTFAILLFGAGGPEIRGAFADEHIGYLVMALVAGVLIGLGMLVAATTAGRRVVRGASSRADASVGPDASGVPDASVGADAPGMPVPGGRLRDGYREGFAALARSAPFRALLGAFVLQGLATGGMLAGAQYVATWVLRSEGAVTLLFVALIAPALACAPLWALVARRLGKERGFAIASGLFAVAAFSLVLLLLWPGPWVYVPVAIAGAAYAGMQSLPMAMLPDVISYDAARHGADRAGSFSGVWTAGETAGMALGSTLLTVVLAATGYVSSAGSAVVEQGTAAIVGIVLSFSLLPALLVLASLGVLQRYSLRRSDIDALAAMPEAAPDDAAPDDQAPDDQAPDDTAPEDPTPDDPKPDDPTPDDTTEYAR
ncbi:MFS transporter [Agromyces aerolatus]|uniref:MFS transporter n=1 Tax=Agromyces sp. LY-1074 TaxID=3074080 RepID=UPI00285F1540|nr:MULTISPECIES: MFS transporter [unclassified Agromyces]MDR5698919.1 MFS transporter [Agromyces sp. LY-1074]MDR5705303.1 MFS transporter [Agromyces sp. LY-1358]